MPLEKHPLKKEFPEHQALIEKLESQDESFSRLVKKYSDADEEIYELENKSSTTDEEHLEQLKLERVKLKDELFEHLQRHAK